MPAIFHTAFDLALVVFGFGSLVFLHELGHFIAARWAGIRVLAFALGFGPALVSYRKGMGLRRGSTESEYFGLIAQAKSSDQDQREAARRKLAGDAGGGKPPRPIGTTEYRFNALPLGGYVKMLGQEDANPQAVSDAPDSYQSCPPIKRMVVISAGVVANILTAIVLFITVFMVGMRTEPAAIGLVDPTGPAASAHVIDTSATIAPGLKPGDKVLMIDGEAPRHFNDLSTRVAMSEPHKPLHITVERPGIDRPLEFEVTPRVGLTSGLREIAVTPPFTSQIDPHLAKNKGWKQAFEALGLAGVEPGMRLVTLGGKSVENAADAIAIVEHSKGQPLEAEFASEDDRRVTSTITPVIEFELDDANPDPEVLTPIDHLLGLMPVLSVSKTAPRGAQQGLQDGDVFVRLGEVEYPSVLTGVREIQRHAGRTLHATVLRTNGVATPKEVDLEVLVTRKGTIGFTYTAADATSNLFALPPEKLWTMPGGEAFTPAATPLIQRPGTSVVAIEGQPTDSLAAIREALRTATAQAFANNDQTATVNVELLMPPTVGDPSIPVQPERVSVAWTLDRDQLHRLHSLSYSIGALGGLFAPEQFLLKADNPLEAVTLGLGETRRIGQQTYLTFLRLFQGSVKVEHLRGPVGIAHIGTMLADRGLIWLMFYLALISINLAVVNFLPLPIVDGGQFLMLIYEQIRGKPVPMALQGALTLAGLALVGMVFLVVTFNDISNLLGR